MVAANLSCWLVLASALGCGPQRPETAPIRGTVTYDGQPVKQGLITFYPESGRPALGTIREDGSYALTTFTDGDGAIVGEHRVTVRSVSGGDALAAPLETVTPEGEVVRRPIGAAVLQWQIPHRYADRNTTPLRCEVVAGDNFLDFDLPAEADGPR